MIVSTVRVFGVGDAHHSHGSHMVIVGRHIMAVMVQDVVQFILDFVKTVSDIFDLVFDGLFSEITIELVYRYGHFLCEKTYRFTHLRRHDSSVRCDRLRGLRNEMLQYEHLN